jgi:Tfp pilus assembly protein PilN
MKPVNLLPQEARRRPAGGRAGSAYVVCGVLGALLLMVLGYVVVSNQATSRANDAAAADAKATALEQEAASRADFSNFAQIKQQRLASVSSVAQTRFDWERFMRELARIMPERSWVQTADASVAGDPTNTGAASTVAPGTTGAEPTAKLVGCTPKQSDTATMMVRLRQLYRVSDVKLNESSLEALGADAGTETTVDACGAYYKFDITVTFSPTPPASEAPRGATRVPASLGGGS